MKQMIFICDKSPKKTAFIEIPTNKFRALRMNSMMQATGVRACEHAWVALSVLWLNGFVCCLVLLFILTGISRGEEAFMPARSGEGTLRYDAIGNLYQVYLKRTNYPGENKYFDQCVYRRYPAGGSSWDLEEIVCEGPDTSYFSDSNFFPWNGITEASDVGICLLVDPSGNNIQIITNLDERLKRFQRSNGAWSLAETIMINNVTASTPHYQVEYGPDQSIHLVMARSGGLWHGCRLPTSGAWTWSEVSPECWTNDDMDGRLESMYARPMSLAVGEDGVAHVTYCAERTENEVAGGTFTYSNLYYATNQTGSWANELLAAPGTDPFPAIGDAGLGANVAVSPSGVVSVAGFFLPRANTGSPKAGYLYFRQRLASGNWTYEKVAGSADGYVTSEGNLGTGVAPDLEFSPDGTPHIAFSDHASKHLPGYGASSAIGQLRHAFKIDGKWNLNTRLVQRDPAHNYFLYPDLAVGPSGRLAFCGIVGTNLPPEDQSTLYAATSSPFMLFATGPLPSAPEIVVEQPAGIDLTDTVGRIDFGYQPAGTTGTAISFKIRNTGKASLTGLSISKNGANAADFAIESNGMATTLAPGASTTFTVKFMPGAAAVRSASLHIASNDADENTFDIALTGTAAPSDDPFRVALTDPLFEPRVGHQLTLDLKRLANPGETIKLVGKLPTGLKFNATTGLLSGVISGKAGSYPLTVQFLQGKAVVRTVSMPMTILPYPATLLGSFEGLLEDAGGKPEGVIRLSITKSNAWSATLESAGASKRSAKGSFLLNQQTDTVTITVIFPVSGTVPAESVTLNLNADSPLFAGTHSSGGVRGFRMAQGAEIISSTSVCNIALDAGEQEGIAAPAGIGWLSGKFGKSGSGGFKGLLGDATTASVSLRISATGQALVWSQPYANKQSFIAGIIDLPATWNSSSDNQQLESGLWWSKAADAKTLAYPTGFGPLSVEALGAAWTPPASAIALGNALGWADGPTANLLIEGAGLSNAEPQVTAQALPTALTLDDKFNLNATAPQGVILVPWFGKVAKADGKWSGTLTLPAGFAPDILADKASASGVLLPGMNGGGGLIKVPVAGPKGAFRTSALLLEP